MTTRVMLLDDLGCRNGSWALSRGRRATAAQQAAMHNCSQRKTTRQEPLRPGSPARVLGRQCCISAADGVTRCAEIERIIKSLLPV